MCVECWTQWTNHRSEKKNLKTLKIRNDNWRTTASTASTLSHIHTVQLKILSTLTRPHPSFRNPWFSPLHATLFCRKIRPAKTESPYQAKTPHRRILSVSPLKNFRLRFKTPQNCFHFDFSFLLPHNSTILPKNFTIVPYCSTIVPYCSTIVPYCFTIVPKDLTIVPYCSTIVPYCSIIVAQRDVCCRVMIIWMR